MINENCVKDVMLTLEEKLSCVKGIKDYVKVKDIYLKPPLNQYDVTTIKNTVNFLMESKLIKAKSAKNNALLYKINFITPQGEEFLKVLKQPKLIQKLSPILKTTAPLAVEILKKFC